MRNLVSNRTGDSHVGYGRKLYGALIKTYSLITQPRHSTYVLGALASQQPPVGKIQDIMSIAMYLTTGSSHPHRHYTGNLPFVFITRQKNTGFKRRLPTYPRFQIRQDTKPQPCVYISSPSKGNRDSSGHAGHGPLVTKRSSSPRQAGRPSGLVTNLRSNAKSNSYTLN